MLSVDTKERTALISGSKLMFFSNSQIIETPGVIMKTKTPINTIAHIFSSDAKLINGLIMLEIRTSIFFFIKKRPITGRHTSIDQYKI